MSNKKFVHECQLTNILETNYPKLEDKLLTRIWAYLFLISKKYVGRQVLRLSEYGVILEMDRHLKSYPNVIHPFSLFRYAWEIFMIMLFMIQMLLLVLPQMVYKNINEVYYIRHIYFALNQFFLLDISLNFCTGIFDSKKYKIILEKKIFIRQYCFSLLVPDVLAFMPIDYTLRLLNMRDKLTIFQRLILVYCKYMFIFRLKLYLNRLREKMQWPLHIYKMGQLVIYFVLLFCLCISLLETVVNAKLVNDISDHLSYVYILSSANNMIFGFESSTFLIDFREIVVHIFGRLCGTVLLVKFVAYIASYFANRNLTKQHFMCKQKEMQTYFKLARIRPEVRENVNKYHRYFYEGQYYDENYIWRNISDELRSLPRITAVIINVTMANEYTNLGIFEYIKRAIYDILEPVLKTDIFSVCPLEMLYMIAAKFHKRRYLRDMEIHQAGTYNTMLIVVRTGSIKLITEDKQEVAVLYEGKVFHDVLPLTEEHKEHRMYTVVANDNCLLDKLLYKRLNEIAEKYPDVQQRINEILARKTRVILQNPYQLDLNAYFSTDN